MNQEYSIRLGLLIPIEKKKKIRLPERIEHLCREEGIHITEIDVFGDLEEQGPFDVLFHKVVDLHKEDLGYMETERLIQKVSDYAAKHPEMRVIDNFEVVRNLRSRKFQFKLLTKLQMQVDGITIYAPKTLEIEEGTSLKECRRLVKNSGVRFPVLAKPFSSCLKGAHDITIIFDVESLRDMPMPCLLQEFCNHGGIIYKVFVIGDVFKMCERPSIKDIDCLKKNKSLVFDTRDVSKTGKAFIPELHAGDPNARTWLSCDENPDMLNRKAVNALRERIAELTDMKVYGLDVLVDEQGNYAIVDLNHFPGFTGIKEEHFSKNVVAMIKQSVIKK
jgi:Inositol 1, 3, 4-trisphosphate 5/6-kinase.